MASRTPPASDAALAPGAAPRPFLGWRVVGAAASAHFLSVAVTFSAFGVFVIPLSEAFDTPRGQLNLGFSLAFLVAGAMGPLVGRWLDRGLARTVMLAGTALAAAGLMGLSRATELWQMALLFCGVVSLGSALFGPTASMALVANWFVRRRGLALGFAVAGATIGSFVAPIMAAYLIEHIGWRGALFAFGVATLAIGLPVFSTLVIARPESVGQAPDGDPVRQTPTGEASVRAPAEVETGQLIRDPRLWMVAVGFGLVFTSPIVMMLALVPFAEDLGYSRQNATFFFSAAAPFSLIGKIVFGALADRMPSHVAIWIVVISNMAVWALLHTDPGYTPLLAIGAFYGLGIGATGPLHGVVLGLCFGRNAFGRAAGIGGLAGLPLMAAVPALAGYLYDLTGGYHSVFLAQIAMLLLGGTLLSFVSIPRAGVDHDPVAG